MQASTSAVEQYRVTKFSSEEDGFNGLFFIPGDELPPHYGESVFMRVIASSGFGWDHVSIMHPDREITNKEVERVRRLFWGNTETVVEYHDEGIMFPIPTDKSAPRHLWCPQGCEVIRPPERIFSPFLISIAEDGVENYQQVESSNISAVKYDPEDSTLYVVFTSGGHYSYAGVPQDVYDSLMEAESVGKFFHASIRNAFQAKKMEEEE